jgi:hypothetical protein
VCSGISLSGLAGPVLKVSFTQYSSAETRPGRGEKVLQALQIGGALMILAAFALVHYQRLNVAGVTYFILNLVGAIALGVSALAESQWGFVMLETAWAAISARGLVAAMRAS